MKSVRALLLFEVLAWSGCGSDSGFQTDAEASTTSATTTGSSTGHSTTTGALDDTGTASTNTTGMIFLIEPDMGPAYLCDILDQDCPPGEKCMPWANSGGSAWNATKCVPVVDEPAGTDEPCQMEGSPTSGIDDCDLGAMCWDVDPDTLEGICTPFCIGEESNPYCEDPARECTICGDNCLPLCLLNCSPLLQDCPPGQGCYSVADGWLCVPDASGDAGGYGDPCDFINACDPGLVCWSSHAVPPGEGCEGAGGCCTEVCDLTDPAGDLQCAGAAGGQTCQAWYDDGDAPPGLENVGACALPA